MLALIQRGTLILLALANVCQAMGLHSIVKRWTHGLTAAVFIAIFCWLQQDDRLRARYGIQSDYHDDTCAIKDRLAAMVLVLLNVICIGQGFSDFHVAAHLANIIALLVVLLSLRRQTHLTVVTF